MKTKIAAILIVLYPLVIGQAQANETINHRPAQVTEAVGMDTVVFVDHALNRRVEDQIAVNLSIDSSGISSNHAGYQTAWAVFRNHTDYEYAIDVRAQFFDRSQMMLPDVTKWQRVYIPANSLARYAQLSIDDRTFHFRLEVRSTK
jgi:hypothetical protein